MKIEKEKRLYFCTMTLDQMFQIPNFIWNLHINSLFLISDDSMIFNACDSVKKNYFIWKIQHGFNSQVRMECLRCTNRKYIAYIVLYLTVYLFSVNLSTETNDINYFKNNENKQ